MSTDVVCLNEVPVVQDIVRVLEETTHHGFPIVDEERRFVGLILRVQLITLLQKKAFREDANVILPVLYL